MSFSGWTKPHLAQLEAWHIDRKTAERRGYRPLSAAETYALIGQRVPTIQIPCIGPDGKRREESRFRCIGVADRKYTQRAGTGPLLHHALPRKPSRKAAKRVIIVEGEVKADALAEALGIHVISIPGVTATKLNGELHPDLAALAGLDVEIGFDTDSKLKPEVGRALSGLAGSLDAAGAHVSVREIPPVPNLAKSGPDDVLHHYGPEGYLNAPLHRLDSPAMQAWRKQLGKADSTLPEALRDLAPNVDWYTDKPPENVATVQPILFERETALMVGAAGTGKSQLALDMFASIATGRPFLGLPVPSPLPALYLMLERGENSLRRRWHRVAHAVAKSLPAGERQRFESLLRQNAILRCLSGDGLRLIRFDRNEWVVADVVHELIAVLKELGIRVLFLDPLSRLHGANENDAAVAATLTRALELIVREVGCSVVLVHHTGKTTRGDQYSGRGSSAFNDNTSQCLVLSIMEPEERARLDLSHLSADDLAHDIVRVHHARCSDGPRLKDDILLLRDADGLLHRLQTSYLSPEQAFDADKARRHFGAESFTMSQLLRARAAIFPPKTSKARATEVLNAAVAAGHIKKCTDAATGTPQTRNGGLLYELPSAPGNSGQLGNSAKRGTRHVG